MAQKKETGLIGAIIAAMALVMIMAPSISEQVFAVKTKMSAKLSGQEMVPPVSTQASGDVDIKSKQGILKYKVNLTGTGEPTGLFVHMGKSGENGDPVVDLLKIRKMSTTSMGNEVVRGNLTEAIFTGPFVGKTVADFIDLVSNGQAYIVAHTEAHPNGELRGQLQLTSSTATTSGSTMADEEPAS